MSVANQRRRLWKVMLHISPLQLLFFLSAFSIGLQRDICLACMLLKRNRTKPQTFLLFNSSSYSLEHTQFFARECLWQMDRHCLNIEVNEILKLIRSWCLHKTQSLHFYSFKALLFIKWFVFVPLTAPTAGDCIYRRHLKRTLKSTNGNVYLFALF